jgi:hypothetical protein
MIYVILLLIISVPLFAIALLLIVGLVRPEVRRKGLRQISQPFFPLGRISNKHVSQKQRSELEDEVIRRFGKSGEQ